MTTLETSHAPAVAPASAALIHCPIPHCAAFEHVGVLWLDGHAGAGLAWQTRLDSRPGVVAGELSSFAAARRTLIAHVRDAHVDRDCDEPWLANLIALAARNVSRAVQGLPALVETLPITAECVDCGARLYRVADDWFDDAGVSLCVATADMCPNLCRRVHAAGSETPVCGHCDGVAEVYWAHTPVPCRSAS